MSKPALTDLDSGQEAWDATVNDNHDVLTDGPFPVKEYADIATLAAVNPATHDRCIAATADGKLWISTGTAWVSFFPDDGGGDAYGAGTRPVTKAELLADLSVSASTASDFFPADCIKCGVTAVVPAGGTITASGGGTSFMLGDGTDADRYAAGKAFAAGTKVTPADRTAAVLEQTSGDEAVVAAPDAGAFTAGALVVIGHYLECVPPT